MTYTELHNMVVALRNDVVRYCQETAPTLDEAWSLEIALSAKYWNKFGKPTWNQGQFQLAIENTVRKEILKNCGLSS